MLRLDWSLSRLVTQDIKTQPQINRELRETVPSWVFLRDRNSINLRIWSNRHVCTPLLTVLHDVTGLELGELTDIGWYDWSLCYDWF